MMPEPRPLPPSEHLPPYTRHMTYRDEVLNQAESPLRLAELGAAVGSTDTRVLGFAANLHLPQLLSHDPQGRRLNEVEYHPAYHQLMRLALALESGWHSAASWRAPGSCGSSLSADTGRAGILLPYHHVPHHHDSCGLPRGMSSTQILNRVLP